VNIYSKWNKTINLFTSVKLFHQHLQGLLVITAAQQQHLVVTKWIYFRLRPDKIKQTFTHTNEKTKAWFRCFTPYSRGREKAHAMSDLELRYRELFATQGAQSLLTRLCTPVTISTGCLYLPVWQHMLAPRKRIRTYRLYSFSVYEPCIWSGLSLSLHASFSILSSSADYRWYYFVWPTGHDLTLLWLFMP